MAAHVAPDFFQTLFHDAPVGLALCLLDTGKLVEVNQAYADLLNRTIEETLELSYWQITPRRYEQQEKEQLELLRKNNRYGPYEKEYIRKDESRIPVRLSGVVVNIDDQKYIWSTVESLLDERYHQLFLAAKPALALSRLDDRSLVAVNKAYAVMIGYSVEEALQLSILQITPAFYEEDEQIQLTNLKKNGEYGPYQKKYIHKDGHMFHVYLSGILMKIGGIDLVWSCVNKGIVAGDVVLKDGPPNPILERSTAKADCHKPIME